MIAEKVHAGQEIRASQLNDVIDAVSINQPIGDAPFRNTKNGTLVNGGSNYITKAPSSYDPVFNITYGSGYLSELFNTETGQFNGIWVQLADWQSSDLYLYHSIFFNQPTHLFLIDPFSEDKLVWLVGDLGKQGKWPLCEATNSAGLAVFQLFTNSPSGSTDPKNGVCCIVIGDFTKMGAQHGTQPDPDANGTWNDYLTAIKGASASAQTYFAACNSIACRHIRPMYSRNDDLEEGELTVPVAYTVGQQNIETLPDTDQTTSFVGKDVMLSSLAFTPAKQFNIDFSSPTWSESLFHFDKYNNDYSSAYDLKIAPDLSGGYGPGWGLSSFDILLRHKAPHPDVNGQAWARLEYFSLAGLGDLFGTVDSAVEPLELSSIQDKTYTDDETGEETKYHQLFNFDQGALTDFKISDDCDIVLRDYTRTRVPAGAAVNYVKLSTLLSSISETKVDTWATQGGQRSIDWNTQNNNRYLQLYNFDNSGYEDALRVNLVYGEHRYATKDGTGEYPDPYVEFVVRDRSGARMVKYDALDIYAPPIQASDVTDLSTVISAIVEHECSCDLGPISAALGALSSQLSNYWKVGGTYNDNCYGQSIGDDSGNPQIDLNNGQLLYSNDQDPTLDWHNGYLSWNNGELRLDWGNCETYDKNQGVAIGWDLRHLYDAAGNLALRWSDRILHDSNQTGALDWDNRTLYDSSLHIVADWERKQLLDSNTIPAVDWGSRHLDDPNQNVALNWQQRTLEGNWTVNGNLSVEQGATLTIGNTTLTEAQLSSLLRLI